MENILGLALFVIIFVLTTISLKIGNIDKNVKRIANVICDDEPEDDGDSRRLEVPVRLSDDSERTKRDNLVYFPKK